MKRGGGEETASTLAGDARGTSIDASGFLSGGGTSVSSSGYAGGDVSFTPGRVVVDKDDQLVRN